MYLAHHIAPEHKDNINFKIYRGNPIEFLERVDEWFNRIKVTRWNVIKSYLHECFKSINDNWWSAVRNELSDYEEFKRTFKSKYWSDSVQNMIRDNITNGRFNVNQEQSPTTYFLGKVCLARHLEPRIPEECLVNKLSYHFEEEIVRARRSGQVKTIETMETLLASYETVSYTHLDVYKRQVQ